MYTAYLSEASPGDTAYISPLIDGLREYAVSQDGQNALVGVAGSNTLSVSFPGTFSGSTKFSVVPIVPAAPLLLVKAIIFDDGQTKYLRILYPRADPDESLGMFVLTRNREPAQDGDPSPVDVYGIR